MIKYNNTNNASTTLTAGISASSTTLIVENGDILPTAPFLLTLEHFDNEKVTVREIVKCIAKVGTILTIQRGAGTCVQDDSASTKEQGNSAHSFSVGDCASIYWTSEQVQDIQNEIEKKLNIDDFQAGTYVYGATSTETDAYSITIPGTLTSYSVGQVFRFMADVDNEGNATLNINGLGAVEIRKNHDKILDNGDIEAGQIVEVAYDGTYFQMDSQVATVVDIASLGNTQYKTGVAGEDLETGDVCCLVDFENDYFEMKLFGTTESSVECEVIGNGGNDNSITLWLGRRGNSSGEDLVVELLDGETVIASSQIARSGLTEDTTVETVCSWGESIETEKGKIYTLRLRTYDNSVDADKGFYYNRNSGVRGRYKESKKVPCPTEGYSGIYTNFSLNLFRGHNFDFNIQCGENLIRVYETQRYIVLDVNGTIKSSSGITDIDFLPGKIVYKGDTTSEITIDENVYKITSRSNTEDLNGSSLSLFTIPNNNNGVNYKTANLSSRLFYKGNDWDLYVSSNNVNKGDDCLLEIGGNSNIFLNGDFGERLYVGGSCLGYYDKTGRLIYNPKHFQETPSVDTYFKIYKPSVLKYISAAYSGEASSKLFIDGIVYFVTHNPQNELSIQRFNLDAGISCKYTTVSGFIKFVSFYYT